MPLVATLKSFFIPGSGRRTPAQQPQQARRTEATVVSAAPKDGTTVASNAAGDARATAPASLGYGPARLEVNALMREAMRHTVDDAVRAGLCAAPTAQQWAFIFNDLPARQVIAAAGSGKSATLALRLVFLVCHAGLPLSEITISSFTRKSCDDLRDKIKSLLTYPAWSARLPEIIRQDLDAALQPLVRTFHSALVPLASRLFPGMNWFEFVGQERPQQTTDAAQQAEDRLLALNEEQIDLLKQAYAQCHASNPDFAQHVKVLRRMSLADGLLHRSEQGAEEIRKDVISMAARRDLALVETMNFRFLDKARAVSLDWPGQEIELRPIPITGMVHGHVLHANGMLRKTGQLVLLCLNGTLDGDPLFDEDEQFGTDRPIKARMAVAVRNKILRRHYGGNALHINGAQTVAKLRSAIDEEQGEYTAHPFDIHLPGELSSQPIYEAFFAQGSFIESLGTPVVELIDAMQGLPEKGMEWHFARALRQFWPVLERTLADARLMMFNTAFLRLARADATEAAQFPVGLLTPFTHLLVDEFQDISPQIVAWIRSLHRQLVAQGRQPSIEAIGDDWQSIYGWRGSAPELFIHFHRHFPLHPLLGAAAPIRMEESFRSTAPIVQDGLKLLLPVQNKTEKTPVSRVPTLESDHGVKKICVDPGKPAGADKVAQLITEQLDFLARRGKTTGELVLVIARKNGTVRGVRRAFSKVRTVSPEQRQGVRFLTMHSAKGLQAEVVILCDDIQSGPSHPLRNAIYRARTIFSQSYDQAATDEAYRLAYVGVTRGKRRVFWCAAKFDGASRGLG